LKPGWWGSPLVQKEKYQEKHVKRKEEIIIIIIIIIIMFKGVL
jgi:flagellar basal body-associated protein FliL